MTEMQERVEGSSYAGEGADTGTAVVGRWTGQHPLDAFVADPAGQPPLCDEEEFAALLEGIVADSAPRQFAIVHVYGDRVDGEVVAWGMCFDDGAEVVSEDGRVHFSVPSPEHALRRFRFGTRVTPRIVWYNADAATPADPGQAALPVIG